jgi:uncharacterized protein (UPF0335 family)
MSDRSNFESVAGDQLQAFIERVERLREEIDVLNTDVKEVYAEARGNGFDVKVIKKIIAIRRMDHNERMEQEALLELYMSALGMATAPGDYE